MTGDPVSYEPIGTVHSPFGSVIDMPVQPTGSDARGSVELDDEHAPALADLADFSHCILIYHFHQAPEESSSTVEPFLDDQPRGLFATRAPSRPNDIGLSVVEIEAIDGPTIQVTGIDVIDGTPLLDIKPFVGAFDVPERIADGWIGDSTDGPTTTRSDDRFS